MLRDETVVGQFSDFLSSSEPGLRRALTAAYGSEVGREATAEALAYAWEHWDRLRSLDNPAGYVFRVGQGKAKRMRHQPRVVGDIVDDTTEPWIEPRLASAMGKLTERQRVVVSLLHGFDWSMSEVAALIGISKASVQTHANRAMKTLKRELGVE